jgi:hypothetical protein
MTTRKNTKIIQKTGEDEYTLLHPETNAANVLIEGAVGNPSNVKDEIEKIISDVGTIKDNEEATICDLIFENGTIKGKNKNDEVVSIASIPLVTQTDFEEEVKTREDADTTLQENIDKEIEDRKNAIIDETERADEALSTALLGYLLKISGGSEFFNETDGGGLVFKDASGREVAGIALNANCPQLYIHRYNDIGTLTNRVLLEVHDDGLYISTVLTGTAWVKIPDTNAVNALIATAIGGISHFGFSQPYATTDSVPTPDNQHIYLIGVASPYDEYCYINGVWDRIGTAELDLSNYYTKAQVDTNVAAEATARIAADALKVNATDIRDNLASSDTNKPLSANQGRILNENKVDKIDGKDLSSNDYTDADKQKLSSIAANETKASNLFLSEDTLLKNTFAQIELEIADLTNLINSDPLKIGDIVADGKGTFGKVSAIETANATIKIIATSGVIAQSAYVNKNLKEILTYTGLEDNSKYYATNDTTHWAFIFPLSQDFILKSIDGGTRFDINAALQEVEVYFEDNLKAKLTSDAPTYRFLGEAIFRGYDCLGYDNIGQVISFASANLNILVTQDALTTGLEDIVASIANLYGQVNSQRARIVANLTAASLNKVRIRPAHTKLIMEDGAVNSQYFVYHYPQKLSGLDVYFGFGVNLDASLNPTLTSFRTVGNTVEFYTGSGSGSIAEVVHDGTLKGNGTIASPLGVEDGTIPEKTSDLENDGQDGVNPYVSAPEVTAAVSAHNTSPTAHSDIRQAITTEAGAREAADTTLQSAIDAEAETAREAETELNQKINAEEQARLDDIAAVNVKADEAIAIAEGRSRARVFATVDEMNEWLADETNLATLQIGDNLYIMDTDVTDYWWNGSTALPLETEKVDLTDYYTKSQITLLLASKVTVEDFNNALLGKVDKNGTDRLITAEEGEKLAELNKDDYATAAQGETADTALQSVPLATENAVGGFYAESAGDGEVYPVRIDANGQGVVAVGADGKSAYELAVADGFVGTLEEWFKSLRGQDALPNEAFSLLTEGIDYTTATGQTDYTTVIYKIITLDADLSNTHRIFNITYTHNANHGSILTQTYPIHYSIGGLYAYLIYGDVKEYTTQFSFNPLPIESPTENRVLTMTATLSGNTLTLKGTLNTPLLHGTMSFYQQPDVLTIYELRGQGIAPNIQPAPGNDENTYKLRVNVVGRESFDTDNLKGVQGAKGSIGNTGATGKPSIVEVIPVAQSDFTDDAITIYPDTEDYEAEPLKHHIQNSDGDSTGYILTFKRVGDVNTPITASVTDDGIVTIETEAFDGEILLTAGSTYRYVAGGAAEHRLLVEGDDYTISNFFDDESTPVITFTKNDDCPVYRISVLGYPDDNPDAIIFFDLELTKEPFIMTQTDDETGTSLSFGYCSTTFVYELSSSFLGSAKGIYLDVNGTECWAYVLENQMGANFVTDTLQIIKI